MLHCQFTPAGVRRFLKHIPYLFELRHPVPRPNFDWVPLFKKSKDQPIIDAAHDKDLDYEPVSPCHLTFQDISVTQKFLFGVLDNM